MELGYNLDVLVSVQNIFTVIAVYIATLYIFSRSEKPLHKV